MEEKTKVNYKGYEIEFDEWSEVWELKVEDSTGYTNTSLKAVKKYADRLLKKGFKEFEVLCHNHWGDVAFEKRTVTSIDDNGDYWTRDKEGKRNKEQKEYLYKLTDENLKKIEEIKKFKEERNKLHSKENKTLEEMEKLK